MRYTLIEGRQNDSIESFFCTFFRGGGVIDFIARPEGRALRGGELVILRLQCTSLFHFQGSRIDCSFSIQLKLPVH